MIQTRNSCGLKCDPVGRRGIRCDVLILNGGLGDAGFGVASTVAVTGIPCTPSLAEFLFPAVIISICFDVVVRRVPLVLPIAVLPQPPAPR